MMTSRQQNHHEWQAASPVRNINRTAHEPRDEILQLPKSLGGRALRPRPVNIPSGSPPSAPKAPPASRKENVDATCDRLCASEVLALAAPGTWPRRGAPVPTVHRMQSPSVTSEYSFRHSEMSFGILDYYTREPTPLTSPDFPPPQTQKIDPAIKHFDFGLAPAAQAPPRTQQPTPVQEEATTAGASQPDSPPPSTTRAQEAATRRYGLFPSCHDTPPIPSIAQPSTSSPQTPTLRTTAPVLSPPDPSYRPRKESLSTSSVRSRNDSLTSFRGGSGRLLPLRILSSTTTKPTPRTTSASSPPSSGGAHSRWSDDTITSPTATPSYVRTSSGSLLGAVASAESCGRESYPACFFDDDDDERVPLRRKVFGLRSSAGYARQSRARGGKAREGETRSGREWTRWVVAALTCGCVRAR